MNDIKIHPVLFPLLLVLYEVVTYLSNDSYLPALPQIQEDLFTTQTLVQLSLTTWFLGTASMQLVLGPVSDRYGRRPVLLVGALVYIITTAICSVATDIMTLIVIRFFQGITITSMIVAGYATIHELFDQKKAIHTLAWMNSIVILAPAVGPLFGAVILYFAGWRWIFGALTIAAMLTTIGLYFYMPETNKDGYKQPIQVSRLMRQYWQIVSNIEFLCYTLMFCLLFCGMIAWIVSGPFLVIETFEYSVFWFAIFQAYIFTGFILGARLVKPFMRIYSLNQLINYGLALALIGGISSPLLSYFWPNFLGGMIISMTCFACGSGLTFSILSRKAIESSQEPMGMRMAIFSSLMSIFGAIGSIIINIFYDNQLMSLSYILFVFAVLPVWVKMILKKNIRNIEVESA